MVVETDDGTVLIVSVTTAEGKTVDVGSMEIVLGIGSFELNSVTNRFSPAFPVDEISSVTVRKGDTVLLEGRCLGEGIKPLR